jgi:hypothetical protein
MHRGPSTVNRHSSSPSRDLVYYGSAMVIGGLIGWLDVVLGEIFVTALLLLVCGMGFGLWRPPRGWAAGICLAVGVTTARIVIHLLRPQPHAGQPARRHPGGRRRRGGRAHADHGQEHLRDGGLKTASFKSEI